MTYYFFDNTNGNVNLIYYVKPPIEILQNNHNYIISDKIFEEREGLYLDLKVDLATKELIGEYKPIPPKPETEIEILKREVAELKEQLKALKQTINVKQ